MFLKDITIRPKTYSFKRRLNELMGSSFCKCLYHLKCCMRRVSVFRVNTLPHTKGSSEISPKAQVSCRSASRLTDTFILMVSP